MKKIISFVFVFFVLSIGKVFSQVDEKIPLVIKTVYENDGFYGLGLDLGSLKNRKIEVFSNTVFSKKRKIKQDEDLFLVVEEKLTGTGEIVVFNDGPKPGEVTFPSYNNTLAFKTVNKKIEVQEWAGGQDEFDLFHKLMASEHHTYNLNSTIIPQVSVEPIGENPGLSIIETLEWLVKNYNIYNFSNRMDDKVKIYKHTDKKGNACFLFYNPRTFTGPGNKPGTSGTFIYVEKPEDKLLRLVLNAIKLNIKVDDNSFEIEKFTNSGPDEVIPNEKMLSELIKDTFKEKPKDFWIKKNFIVKTTVTKDY